MPDKEEDIQKDTLSEVQDEKPLLVVGVGGSAGGLRALITVLEAVDGDLPMAMVVVLHLAPDHHSEAAEILQRSTSLTVSQVTHRTRLEKGHVYVIAPGMDLITDDGHIQPATKGNRRPSTVIDLFFRTLGQVHKENCMAIVLSGTGRDGSLGIAHVREYGGLTIAQALDDCEHEDMPHAAIATGSIDLILSATEIGRRLTTLARSPRGVASHALKASARSFAEDPAGVDTPEQALQDILTALRHHTRYDFRHYKRGTINRRLERRMHVVGLTSIQAYRDLVRKKPDELSALMTDLLISVTNFYRDPTAFTALESIVIPKMVDAVAPGDELRVWIAACASGEEAYSVAILLHEYADKIAHPPRLQLFASDISESALLAARAGVYPANIAADVTEARLNGYFERESEDYFRIRPAVRETVVFALHNALGDPPFSRLDLICCRNLLIYLDRTAQAALLETFAYALKPGGYLFLGNAESVDALTGVFEPVDKEHRIFRLQSHEALPMRMPSPRSPSLLSIGTDSRPPGPQTPAESKPAPAPLTLLHERALAAWSAPSVLINAAFDIERVSQGANRFIAPGEGVPSRSLLNNVAPDIRLELRTALFRATETGKPVSTVFRRNVESETGSDVIEGKGSLVELSIFPVKEPDQGQLRWLVRFDEAADGKFDVPDAEDAAEPASQIAIHRLEEEVRSLKANLQDTLDRSAVSGEELKSSNEELQSINEELRSAKEELETSKEELQSVNEELTTVNFELRMKVEESGRTNDDLRNLMEAAEIATVFVDSSMRVKRFTPQASKLFSLIPSDLGRPFTDVKSRLQYEEIVDDAMAVFKHLRPIERAVKTADGEHYLARLLPYRSGNDKIMGAVLTFINVTESRTAKDEVQRVEERMRDAIAASKDFAVISTDKAGLITGWNEGAERLFGHSSQQILGQPIDLIYTHEDRIGGIPQRERGEADRAGRAPDERWHLRRDGSSFFCSGVLTSLHSGHNAGYLKIARDVSQSKELQLRQQAEVSNEHRALAAVRHTSELKDRFLATMSHELKQPLNLIHVNAEMLMRLPAAQQFPAVRKIGESILRGVGAQEKIVNDLLDLSRVQTGKMHLQRQITDVAELTRQLTQAMASDAAKKDVALEIDVPPSLMCDCDPVRFEQVLWNLLGNAMKFTGQGGRIHVRLIMEDQGVKLEVADSGAGISADFLPRVFDLFSQDHATPMAGAKRSGLGIGLSLVKELVQAHGGRIDAASPGSGQGSTFTVLLPAAQPEEQTETASVRSTSLRLRVLAVDDDADSLEVFAMLLRLEGATVDTAGSGAQALSMLAAGDYDLVLSDIGMPAMSGLEFMQQAREKFPKKRFYSVAITGYAADEDSRAATAAGFDAHVSKPISLARLQAVLEKSHAR